MDTSRREAALLLPRGAYPMCGIVEGGRKNNLVFGRSSVYASRVQSRTPHPNPTQPKTPMDSNENTKHKPSERILRLIASVMDCKGQFLTVEMSKDETPMAASKKAGITLRKQTTMVVRTGVQFANLNSVKEGIANGERGEVQSLPWGEWMVYPYAIIHNGKEYFRFTLGANTRPTCRYWVNDVEVSRADFIVHLPESKRKPSEPSEVITVALDNITRIG